MKIDHPATNKLMRTIVLIGFMGSGKSTMGRILQKKIGYRLIDTDHAIEQEQGMPIPQIFEQHGEEPFRNMETSLLKKLIDQRCHNHVISTGGGMAVREENQLLLRELGFVAWLHCTPKDILAHTSNSNHRPLLQCDDPMAAITSLLEERNPMYEKAAHLKINTNGLEFDEITCGILESARYHFGSA